MKRRGGRRGEHLQAGGWAGVPQVLLTVSLVFLAAQPSVQNSTNTTNTGTTSPARTTTTVSLISTTTTVSPVSTTTTVRPVRTTTTISPVSNKSTTTSWYDDDGYEGMYSTYNSLTVKLPSYARESGTSAKVEWEVSSRYHTLKLEYGRQGERMQSVSCSNRDYPRRHYRDWYYDYRYYQRRRKGVCTCSSYSCNVEVDVLGDSTYTFQVQRYASWSYEPVYEVTKKTDAGVPPFMTNLVDTIPYTELPEELQGTRYYTHTFKFKKEAINHSHGKIRKVQFILSKRDMLEPVKYGFLKDMDDPKSYANYDKPEALYRVYPSWSPHFDIFSFGKDEYEGCQYCNGPLQADTKYEFKIRLFTSKGYADTQIYTFKTKEYNWQTVVVIVTVVVVLFSALFVAHRVYHKIVPNRTTKHPWDISWMMDLDSLVRVCRPITLTDLAITVNALLARGQQALAQEYDELQAVSPLKSTSYANLPDNRPKNRYVNILPYDASRVVLKELENIPHSDYINASYIHGSVKQKEFIATQGPKENTCKDFWRMVWEKHIKIIVMVTQCSQNNKEKCAKYWPNVSEDPIEYSLEKLTVSTLEETPDMPGGYIARRIHITKQAQGSREVQQLQYTAWPDMGCPSSPDQLLCFVNTVKVSASNKSSSILVHCSAGVGRTGTFIAVYNLMREMELNNTVDIFNCVFKMRDMRPNMVQTQVQYTFIYQCVLQHYKNMTGVLPGVQDEPHYDAPEIPDIISNTRDLTLGTMSDYKGCCPDKVFPDPPSFPEGFGDSSSSEES